MYCKYILIIISLLIFAACNKKQEYIVEKGTIFHTEYSIKYEYTHSLQKEIEETLAKFDDSLNPFKPSSIISKVNGNEDVVLDSLFIKVFNRAKEVSVISDGMFDITVSPLINAWGFGFKKMNNVTPSVIDSLKQLVGYNKIDLLNGKIVKLDPRVQINTSAIAKGYATDVIASLLDSYGIKNYMIEIGGEIHTKGVAPSGQCWRIGISQPIEKNIYNQDHIQSVIQLCNKSIATSGDYRKYYIKDGKKYAHTINPKTGYPAETNILSASVIADDCMSADAFATVFMLVDTAKTRHIAEIEKLAYMLILGTKDSTFITVKSHDFDSYILK